MTEKNKLTKEKLENILDNFISEYSIMKKTNDLKVTISVNRILKKSGSRYLKGEAEDIIFSLQDILNSEEEQESKKITLCCYLLNLSKSLEIDLETEYIAHLLSQVLGCFSSEKIDLLRKIIQTESFSPLATEVSKTYKEGQKMLLQTIRSNLTAIKKMEQDLKQAQILQSELVAMNIYRIDKIMPIFCKLILYMEKKHFTWDYAVEFQINRRHNGYGWRLDAIYLVDATKYSKENSLLGFLDSIGIIDTKNSELADNLNAIHDFFENHDCRHDFVKIFERTMECRRGYYNDYQFREANLRKEDEICFEKNYQRRYLESVVEDVIIADIQNPKFDYLLAFMDYCTYWRLENNITSIPWTDEYKFYQEIENLIPQFVLEYKRQKKIDTQKNNLKKRIKT